MPIDEDISAGDPLHVEHHEALAAAVNALGTGTSVAVKDEGSTVVAAASGLDFVGSVVTVSDAGGGLATVTITVPAGLTQEQVEDFVGAMSTDSSSIDFTYNDGAGTITAVVKASSVTPAMLSATGTASAATFLRGDGAWATPPRAFPAYSAVVSGLYFGTPFLTQSGSLATKDTIFATPLWINAPISVDRIAVKNETAGDAGSVARLGIYSDDGTGGYPGALLLDAGTVSITSTGVKEITISQALTAGAYWLVGAIQGTGTPALTNAGGASGFTSGFFGQWLNSGDFFSNATSGSPVIGWSQASVTGALPANFTTSKTYQRSAFKIALRAV